MRTFLATYTYLAGSLGGFAGSLIVLGISRSQRVAMFLSGLLAILWALGGYVIEGSYWQPKRIVGSFTGLEDVLYSFCAGVYTWLVATSVLRRRLTIRLAISTIVRCLIINSLLGFSLFTMFRLFGIPLMASISCSMLAVGSLLVGLRPQLWTMPLLGGIAFPVLHLLVVSCFFNIWPHALTQWNLANLSGILLLGVPIEELEWAIGFAVMWPLLMAHALDVSLTNPQKMLTNHLTTGRAGG
jgi:hypothetical protein